ncbi:MAG: hypothetical protein C5B55_14900 [Blastocatellia bacterium]|nr:MAG: hypothetical protein C5B55_14900 [Blastocatellia bacterium]
MRSSVACFFLGVSLISATTLGQSNSESAKVHPSRSGTPTKRKVSQSGTVNNATPNRTIRICQGVDIPSGYTIIAYETTSACPHGAYILRKDETQTQPAAAANTAIPKSAPAPTAASRPRRIGGSTASVPELNAGANDSLAARPPTLSGTPNVAAVSAPANLTATSLDNSKDDEVGPGDVVRIDTNLVSVPVSVLDRQGRFVPDLKRDNFKVFENGVEQKIAYFEPTEKPFTVALVLDTSGSTFFHLWEIKEAAIAFAKQLRPQDRVLVVTFDEKVLLLTEATNDLNVVTEVINRYANTGFSTRLYDAIDLVINQRLNRIQGRKAIVLFTDGVDTASYGATYQSTLRQAEELDALIYPIEYDTTDFIAATQAQSNVTIVTSQSGSWPFPGRTSSRVIYGPPTGGIAQASTMAEYKVADQYLHELAAKTGARLYSANDRNQLADAFSRIAEELRCQYSLGYYPQTNLDGGERRQIKVRVDQPNLAVRARDSYVQRMAPKSN